MGLEELFNNEPLDYGKVEEKSKGKRNTKV